MLRRQSDLHHAQRRATNGTRIALRYRETVPVIKSLTVSEAMEKLR